MAAIISREIAPLVLADDFADAAVGAVVGFVVTKLAGDEALEVLLDELHEVVLDRTRLDGLAHRALGRSAGAGARR